MKAFIRFSLLLLLLSLTFFGCNAPEESDSISESESTPAVEAEPYDVDYTVESFRDTVLQDGKASASVTLTHETVNAAVMVVYGENGEILALACDEKTAESGTLFLEISIPESERGAYTGCRIFPVTDEELIALKNNETREHMLAELKNEIKDGFTYDTVNGLRILIVSDEHYAIDKTKRIGPLTGDVYQTAIVNSYQSQHNVYGYGSEERLQLLIDTIKEEHKKGKVDAVMVLGDMTDMDFWYKTISKNPSAYLTDTNHDGTVDIDDIYKSGYDEMYYVKTEYYDQLQSFDSDGDGVVDSSIPVFFTIGNHDLYRHDWFLEVFGHGAELDEEISVADNISVYFVTETDYAVLFKDKGEIKTAFLMMNTFASYDEFLDSLSTDAPHTSLKGSQAFERTLEISNDAMADLLDYVSDAEQVYIGAHYATGAKLWKEELADASNVKAIYVGDSHAERDASFQNIPWYIDGVFYLTFGTHYNFSFNFVAEPWSYMMLETAGDVTNSFRVRPDVEYDMKDRLCPYFGQDRGKKATDTAFGTDGVYATMSNQEYSNALFAYTVEKMTEQNGFAPGRFYIRDASGEETEISMHLDPDTGVVTAETLDGTSVDVMSAAYRLLYRVPYLRYRLKNSDVKNGILPDTYMQYLIGKEHTVTK